MSGPTELAIAAGVIVDAGLKATVLLGIGAVATRARGSAAQRHAVWACVFAALPVLPLLALPRGPALDAPWIVGVWAVGFALACAPLVRGLVGLRRLRRAAVADPHTPGLLYSAVAPGPITWGLLRPVVVLPATAASWPAQDRAAALAHERAHIARRDWAVHVAARLISALFWFHPLVWLARRELALEAEQAADDRVLGEGARPTDYARLLLSLAGGGPGPAALGAGSSAVGRRIEALLDVRSRSARRGPAMGIALGMAVVLCPALSAWPAWAPPSPQELTCEPGPTP